MAGNRTFDNHPAVHRRDPGTDDDGSDEAAGRAWEELEGKPRSQVMRFQTMAPGSNPDDRNRDQLVVKKAAGDRLCDLGG